MRISKRTPVLKPATTAIWKPHPKQAEFLRRGEYECLFGGAAGPGKSDALIMAMLRHVDKATYKGLILRRTFPQLQEIADRTRLYYPQIVPGCEYRTSEHRWYFPSGASLKLGHMQHEGDRFNYHGHEYQLIGFDELTQFTRDQYLYMFSRCRSTDPTIRPMIRATSNPGGIGHQWVKDRFLTVIEPEKTYIDPETGFSRVFIPAKITDNPSLLENDPGYIQRLMLLPEIDRMRYLEGIWDAFEGQVFSELSQEIHGIQSFPLPPEWTYFRTFDWGFKHPWACCFWGVDHDGIMYLVSTLYGQKKDTQEMNVGNRMTDTEICREIKKEEDRLGVKFRPGPADSSIWHKRPVKGEVLGPTTAEEMAREGVVWLQADRDRVQGKRQFHTRLRLQEDGRPGVYFSLKDNDHFWRTIPLLREDARNPEDVDSDCEDHIYDAVRYAFMYKPLRPKVQPQVARGSFKWERDKAIKAMDYAKRHGVSLADAYGRYR